MIDRRATIIEQSRQAAMNIRDKFLTEHRFTYVCGNGDQRPGYLYSCHQCAAIVFVGRTVNAQGDLADAVKHLEWHDDLKRMTEPAPHRHEYGADGSGKYTSTSVSVPSEPIQSTPIKPMCTSDRHREVVPFGDDATEVWRDGKAWCTTCQLQVIYKPPGVYCDGD